MDASRQCTALGLGFQHGKVHQGKTSQGERITLRLPVGPVGECPKDRVLETPMWLALPLTKEDLVGPPHIVKDTEGSLNPNFCTSAFGKHYIYRGSAAYDTRRLAMYISQHEVRGRGPCQTYGVRITPVNHSHVGPCVQHDPGWEYQSAAG